MADLALGQAYEAKGKLEIVERAHAEGDKKLKKNHPPTGQGREVSEELQSYPGQLRETSCRVLGGSKEG